MRPVKAQVKLSHGFRVIVEDASVEFCAINRCFIFLTLVGSISETRDDNFPEGLDVSFALSETPPSDIVKLGKVIAVSVESDEQLFQSFIEVLKLGRKVPDSIFLDVVAGQLAPTERCPIRWELSGLNIGVRNLLGAIQ